jgi:hypothetical protein
MGWAQRGSLKSVPVCRVCDEIMDGAQVGMSSWEDLERGTGKSLRDAYKVIKEAKPWFGSALISIFLLTLVVGVSIGFALGNPAYIGFVTLPIAGLATMFFFNLMARSHLKA